jgi:DNA-binding NarL/FixJ family response regulator
VLRAASGVELAAQVESGADLRRWLSRARLDVVLVDGTDAGVDAMTIVRVLASRLPDAPGVLVLTGAGPPADRVTAWSGAQGTIHVHASTAEILAALRMIAAGYSLAGPARRSADGADPAVGSECATLRPSMGDGWGRRLAELSPREVEVLRLVAQGHSNAEISVALSLSDNTVKSHVQRVLGKLGLRNRVSAVILAYELGLVGTRDPEDNSRPAEGIRAR